MTQPTFQELLTSQEARNMATTFTADPKGAPFVMSKYGSVHPIESTGGQVIWQGYLQEAAPPPEPRVFILNPIDCPVGTRLLCRYPPHVQPPSFLGRIYETKIEEWSPSGLVKTEHCEWQEPRLIHLVEVLP